MVGVAARMKDLQRYLAPFLVHCLGHLAVFGYLPGKAQLGAVGHQPPPQIGGDTAGHDDFLARPTDEHRDDARADRRDNRRVAGEHAEITFHAGNVDLIDLAGEGKLFGRDEIEVEGGHGPPVIQIGFNR